MDQNIKNFDGSKYDQLDSNYTCTPDNIKAKEIPMYCNTNRCSLCI